MEFDMISWWTQSDLLEKERRRLAHDFDLARQILVKICNFTSRRVVFIPGNHDFWLSQYISQRPELHELINQDKMLEFKKLGVESVKYGEVFRFGKAAFTHYIARRGAGKQTKYHSAIMADYYGSSIFYGHFHSNQSFTRVTYDSKPNIAQAIGCLCELNPAWLRNSPNAWVHQILFMEFDKAGHFSWYAPILIDGRFIYNGKEFGK